MNDNNLTANDLTLWGVKAVAAVLGVSAAWVRDNATRKRPRIPHHKIGKLLKFKPADIQCFYRSAVP